MKKFTAFCLIILSLWGSSALALSPVETELGIKNIQFDWTGLIPLGIIIGVVILIIRWDKIKKMD